MAEKALACMSWITCRQSRKVYEHGLGDEDVSEDEESKYFMHIRDRYEATMHFHRNGAGSFCMAPRQELRLRVTQEEEACEDYNQSTITARLTMQDDLGYEREREMLDFEWSRGDSYIKELATNDVMAWADLAQRVFQNRSEIAATADFLVRTLCGPTVHWKAEGAGNGSPWLVQNGSPWFPNHSREENGRVPNELFFELKHVFKEAAAK